MVQWVKFRSSLLRLLLLSSKHNITVKPSLGVFFRSVSVPIYVQFKLVRVVVDLFVRS